MTPTQKAALLAALRSCTTTIEGLPLDPTQAQKDGALVQIDAARTLAAAFPVGPEAPPPAPLAAEDLTGEYEGGNGVNFVVSGPADAPTVGFDSRPDPGTGWTQVYDARAVNVLGRRITWRVRFPSPYHEVMPSTWRPMWSQDEGATWVPVVAHTYDMNANLLTFTTPAPSQDRIWIVDEPPYSIAQYTMDKAAWFTSGFCTVTRIGTSEQRLPIERLTITAPGDSTGRKRILQYQSGHQSERFSTWRIVGMLAWACGASPEAAAFRERFVLHGVPISSPDTLVNGWMRSTEIGKHLNRWALGGPNLADEGAEQYALGLDVATLGLALAVDHHDSPQAGDTITYSPGSAAFASLPLATYDPAGRINRTVARDGAWMSDQFSHRQIRLRLGVPTLMYENGGNFHYNGALTSIESSQAAGVSFLRACAARLG